MKKLVALLMLSMATLVSFSQIAVLVGTDTLKGADTLYFTTDLLKLPNGFVAIEASCTDITASSTDDYMIARASISGNSDGFATLNTVDYNVYAAQNDTVSISDGQVALWGVSALPFNYFQVAAFGTAGDTAVISVYVLTKRF